MNAANIRKAADAILCPMTAEFGRIMIEAPDQEIELTLCGHTVRIKAAIFMDLYHATDDMEVIGGGGLK